MMAMSGENEIIAEDKREFSVIDVDDGISVLADSIKSSIPTNSSPLCSIYRVPDNLKKGYEEKYEPSVVCIGPYHCANQNLKITEKKKLWYLGKFISRRPQTSLNELVKAVQNLEEEARACYAEEIHLTSDEFVKMMVIDGCFILELLCRHIQFSAEEDLIHSAPWLIKTIKQDLVLLENQLPFIILECLHQHIVHPDTSLKYMVFNIFGRGLFIWDTDECLEMGIDMEEGSTILEFLHNSMFPCDFNPSADPASDIYYNNIPCAKDLQDMGVKFKTNLTNMNVLDVIFEDGCLTFPYLPTRYMDYYLFPNWIALEQCDSHFKGYITSYILLLGQLINSKDDVKFLRKMEIFHANENDDEKLVTEISGLCRRARPIEYHYFDLSIKVRQYTRTYSLRRYTRSWWNRQRTKWLNWTAILMRDYCGTPWKVISFIAAVILLVLTTIQTIYAIRSYSPK